ncbi:hypothetical protein FACS1894191_6170 [Clostridia bacterium]|nr:hypothetical protein FACS1894191_6170 [Clostridia bacterium]
MQYIYPKLKKVKAEPDFTLLLEYKNGEKRKYNASNLLKKGIFKTLQKFESFKKVKLSDHGDTVCWGDELDIAPESLYEKSISLA